MKYLLFKSVIQLYLFLNSCQVFKKSKYYLLLKGIENPDNNLELRRHAKQYLKRQALFDVIEFIYELYKYKRPSSLSHHAITVIIFSILYKYGNNNTTFPAVLLGMNQATAVFGFNLFIYLKKKNYSTNIRKYQNILMILQQLIIRIPFIVYSVIYVISRLIGNNNLTQKETNIYGIELIVGVLQYFNEMEWLIYV
ncbi:uncharacterized protein METZ01_LOCUS252883 [marine metagenome]|uniref:TLC domain-containing protein n=1 Tax=marine metagenome TaxID=408172 RepID=A0A382IL64_9ZZZZ